jgi:GT2 family glycosyltransferase
MSIFRRRKQEERAKKMFSDGDGGSSSGPLKDLRRINKKMRRVLFERREDRNYQKWIESHDTLTDADRQLIRRKIARFGRRPLISIVTPVYDVEEKWLRLCIESVLKQLYENWELCLADDCSPSPHVAAVLKEYAAKDARIKTVIRQTNGHISAASNSALELATGEFVALLDHDDELSEHALYFAAEEINAHPEIDLLYSDEDKIDENGRRRAPNFKPDWSRDLFYSLNLLTHLSIYRREILQRIGGFRLGTEGSQDYDLGLRTIETIPEKNIRHIPRILYHWRAIAGSVALAPGEKNYAHERGRQALQSHFDRIGTKATVLKAAYEYHRVSYALPQDLPKVSLILAAEDKNKSISEISETIFRRTDYENFELFLLRPAGGNNPREPESEITNFEEGRRVKTIFRRDIKENIAGAFDDLARECDGEILVFLDGLFEPRNSDWLREIAAFARQREIGAVGAKILDPDETIRNGGVILGANGSIDFAHRDLPKEAAGNLARAQVTGNFSAVSGVLAVRREVFIAAGGFDRTNFARGFYDIDFCLRLGEKNMRIVWLPYAELTQHSDSSIERIRRDKRSSEVEFFRKKWKHLIESDPFYNANFSLKAASFSIEMSPRTIKPWNSE